MKLCLFKYMFLIFGLERTHKKTQRHFIHGFKRVDEMAKKKDLRRVLSKSATRVEEHHVCAIDVVHLVGVHRQQNTTYVCLGKGKKVIKKDKEEYRIFFVCANMLGLCY